MLVAPATYHSGGKGTTSGEKKRVRFVGLPDRGPPGGTGGDPVVDRVAEGMERKRDNPSPCPSRFVLGRQRHRLWRMYKQEVGQGGSHFSTGILDGPGTGDVSERERDDSSRESSSSVYSLAQNRQLLYPSIYGQYSDIHIFEQNARKVATLTGGGGEGLTQVRSQRSALSRGTPTRSAEQGGRPIITVADGSQRLVPAQRSLRVSGVSVGSTHDRLVRHKNQHPVATLCFLERGSQGHLRGRLTASRGRGEWVRQSSVRHNRSGASEDRKVGERPHNRGTSMAVTALVAPPVRTSFRRTGGAASGRGPFLTSSPDRGQLLPAVSTLGDPRMQDLRQGLQAQGLSDEVVQVMLSRWAPSTLKNYAAIWRRWRPFCFHKGGDVLNSTIPVTLEFLHEEFRRFGTASSVNHAISAISGATELVSGRILASEPLIRAFRHAVNGLRPPTPAYDRTWDVSILFR